MAARWRATISTLGANASAEGSKLGTGRQNRSWATCPVGERPPATRLKAGGQRVQSWLGVGHRLAHDIEMSELPTQEEGVVDGHERGEVLVERGGLDAEAARHLGQAEAVDAFLGHHILGDVEDLLDGLLAPPGPPIGGSGASAPLLPVRWPRRSSCFSE